MKTAIKPLSITEDDRFVEINFYRFIKHLLDSYNNSILSLDVIESLAQLFNCNITLLKRITQEIYNGTSIIIPTKQELVIMLYKAGVPVRKIRKETGAHPQTVYRYLEEYKLNGQFEYVSKLDEEELVIVKSFMLQLDEVLMWR